MSQSHAALLQRRNPPSARQPGRSRVVFLGIPLSPFAAASSLDVLAERAVSGWIASPGLEGGQVAVLHLHVGSSYHATSAAYSCERGGRITRLSYI
jgi:hypothetical protein